jgi:Zn-dependent M28 family amino/carboxypeptidase
MMAGMLFLRRTLLALALAAFVCAAAPPFPLDADGETSLAAIKEASSPAQRIREDLLYLADDARMGRFTGSEEYLDAARYVAARFAALRLRPGANGEWFQSVPLLTARRDRGSGSAVLLRPNGEATTFVPLKDFLPGRSFAPARYDVTAPAVFAGYGVSRPEAGYDDYAALDVAGKIVVVFSGAPARFNSEERAHFAQSDVKQAEAVARGAAGFVTIPTITSERRRAFADLVKRPENTAMVWVGPDGRPNTEETPLTAAILMGPEGAAKLFAGAPHAYSQLLVLEDAGKPLPKFDIPGALTLKGSSIIGAGKSPNVVGLIPGSDPGLAHEAIVITAHLDHLDVDPDAAEGEDAIRNGALDNAMGVALVLEMARRFRKGGSPKRTVVFVATTGEEQGLIGADYFATFPPLKGRRIVAALNLDMPLALYPFTDVIAFGAERSTLGPIVAAAAKEMGVKLSPDPFAEQGVFTRSDHYTFVRRGTPSVYLFMGFENGGRAAYNDFIRNRYHEPDDDLTQPIDYEAAARFAELNYRVARKIADAREAPRWREGDFFGELFGR